jgi:hypothetical protein
MTTKPPLHYLRCLRALGYPMPTIAAASHPDVCSWETPGHVPDPAAVEALMGFYRATGERVATTETTGLSRWSIAKARAKALSLGFLPPYAYDEDEETGEHTTAHPEAARTDIGVNGRTDDRMAVAALGVARTYLTNPDTTLNEIARTAGVSRVWEEVGPLGLTEIRIQNPKDIVLGRGILDQERARQVLDAAAAVEAGRDPLEVWQEVTSVPFTRVVRQGSHPARVKTAA